MAQIQKRVLLNHKNHAMIPSATTPMGLEVIIPSEASQTERQMPQDTTDTCNLKYDTNELIKHKQPHRHRKQNLLSPKAKGGGRGVNLEFEIRR